MMLIETNTIFDKVDFWKNLQVIFIVFFRLILPQILAAIIIAALLVVAYKIVKKIEFSKLPNWIFPLFLAYSTLGICLGYLAGIATGGVMESFLPVLITLISGILAYITSRDLTNEYRYSIPFLIISFVSSATIGVSYGAYIETLIGR